MALPQRRRGGSPVQFIKDTYAELQKVVWPSRQQTANLTTIVLIVSISVGVLLGGIDWIFTQIVRQFLVPPLP
jgi:preprotein translocase subunit SecE